MAKSTTEEFFEYIPTYTIPLALSNLISAKREMDRSNKVGYDNYAHRLGMCESAQMGKLGALSALGLGTLKEDKDFVEKFFGINGQEKIPLSKILEDMDKDMHNNYEALGYGLTNPDKSCRIWLQDLDYKNNKWK